MQNSSKNWGSVRHATNRVLRAHLQKCREIAKTEGRSKMDLSRKKLMGGIFALAAAGSLFTMTAFALDHDIVILTTNDVHCGVEDNIGYAGLALYRNEMKQQTPYVSLVDAGDAVQGAPIGTLSKGSYIVDIMNKVGYDVAVPGNHEFDYEMPRLLELNQQLNSHYTSANFMDLRTGQSVFEPYKLMNYDDTTVAYVGVTTPESFSKSTPVYFQDAAGNYIYGFCEDETGEKLYNKIQETVDAARGAGADYVVMVGHLGMEGITPRWNTENVVKNTSGIDAVIDGHSHEQYLRNYANRDGKEIPVLQTGTKLAAIGKLTIGTDGAIHTELVTGVGPKQTLPGLTEDEKGPQAGDPEIQTFIMNIKQQLSGVLDQVIGKTDVDLTVNDPDTGKRAVRSAETNLGDLTADAYRAIAGADIGFSNGGGIRADIKAGNITYNDALSVFPFGNEACLISASGQQIKDALEMAARNLPEENGGFLQVSGLSYTVNTAVPSSVVLDEKGNFINVAGAYRVENIMVGDAPLDLAKQYTVASHNYMLLNAGDGMTMFQDATMLKDRIATDVDVLYEYINKNLNGTVGAEYSNPRGQGRITIR